MARFGSLLGDAAVMEETDKRLQCAIEDLRIKYERIRQEEEKAKAEKEAQERAKAEAEASVAVENDWTIGEDADLEGLRQARLFRELALSPCLPGEEHSSNILLCCVAIPSCRLALLRCAKLPRQGRRTARRATAHCVKLLRMTF